MADQKPKKLPPKARTTSGRTTGGPARKPSPPARRTTSSESKADTTKVDKQADEGTAETTESTDGIDKKADDAKAAAADRSATPTKSAPPKAGKRPPKTKISRTDTGPTASGRYTPPSQHLEEMPSPTWVPVLMFTMFGLGMLVIFLNYVELLPGATTNWYLLVGLGLILGGIITATQYR